MEISGIKLTESKDVVLSQSEASQLLSLYFAKEADELTSAARVDRIEYVFDSDYYDLELYELDAHTIRTEELRFKVGRELYEKYKDILNIARITEENIMLAEFIQSEASIQLLGYVTVPELFNTALRLAISKHGLEICEYITGMEDGVIIYDTNGESLGSYSLGELRIMATPVGNHVPYISTAHGKEEVHAGDIIGVSPNGKCILRRAHSND